MSFIKTFYAEVAKYLNTFPEMRVAEVIDIEQTSEWDGFGSENKVTVLEIVYREEGNDRQRLYTWYGSTMNMMENLG